ncbi:hypothetical protein EYE42_13030 [Paracoccus subflavus]|uniref:VPLPA-CTERM sorting domain-containing protein n=1 Tax=Paracoccus subflavus TaxID=2528244 RepID=A0A4Q9G0G2_9RHOB|nr:hypothetical protein [Paracoccus subflavus]TBN38345.1 hypothetical protein EYE42_13030 [Paracoccus subflavus]
MFKFLSAAILGLLPLGASAAPVASPVIDVPLASGAFVAFDGRGDFLGFDAPAASQGLAVTGELEADLSVNFDLADPYGDADGAFALRDDGLTVLEGFLDTITPGSDMLSLIFTGLSGDLAAAFGDGLTVDLFFFDSLGDDPLAALTGGMNYDIAYVVEGIAQPAPIPLPAGGLLLMSGIGLLALRRRCKAQA